MKLKRPAEGTAPAAKLRRLRGPASDDPTLCTDAVDVISLQQIWQETPGGRVAAEEISVLFSYEEKHANGLTFIRGFSLESLRNLVASGAALRHPVSHEPIPEEAIARAEQLAAALKLPEIAYSKDFALLTAEELTEENLEQFALEVFQMLACNNIFISEKIFMGLKLTTLTRLVMELRDMMKQNLPVGLLEILNQGRRNSIYTLPRFPDSPAYLNLLRQFILAETRGILRTANAAQAPLVTYVFVGALAVVNAEVRKCFAEGLVHEYDEHRPLAEDDSEEEGSEELTSSDSRSAESAASAPASAETDDGTV